MKRMVILLGVLLAPAAASAQNTSCAGPLYLTSDGAVHGGTFGTNTEQRWFTFDAKAYRSYVMTLENMSSPDVQTNTFMSIPSINCAQVHVTNTGAQVTWAFDAEPANSGSLGGGDRITIMTATDTPVYFYAYGGTGGAFQVRVEDTTQVNTFFSTYSGFNTFYRLTNTTNQDLAVWIRMVNESGTLIKSISRTIPANQAAPTLNTTAGGDLSIPANSSGFTTFCHNGPPGALALDGFLMQGMTVLPIKIVDARQKR